MPKAIRYIGKKERRVDPTGLTTLVWEQGQTHVVTPEHACALLRFPDIMEEVPLDDAITEAVGLKADTPPTPKPKAKPVEDDARPTLYNFSDMSLRELRAHAKAHLNLTLPAGITEKTARRKVVEADQLHRAHQRG